MIFVNKGIETSTHALTLEIIADTCGPAIGKIATFIVSLLTRPNFTFRGSLPAAQSGPSFAKESKDNTHHHVWVVTDACISYHATTDVGVSCVIEQRGSSERVGFIPPTVVPMVSIVMFVVPEKWREC